MFESCVPEIYREKNLLLVEASIFEEMKFRNAVLNLVEVDGMNNVNRMCDAYVAT